MYGLALVMLRAMSSETSLWVAGSLIFISFLVVVPAIAAAIGYAAWNGKPKDFDREMYWTAFAAAIIVSGFLIVFSQRMHAAVGTWQHLAQMTCFFVGALFFGVAGGCFLTAAVLGMWSWPDRVLSR